MVVLMIASTFPLVRETALILMQTTPGFIEVEEIKKELLKVSFAVILISQIQKINDYFMLLIVSNFFGHGKI